MIVLEKHSDYASHLQKQQRGKRSKKESNLNLDMSHNIGGCIPEMLLDKPVLIAGWIQQ